MTTAASRAPGAGATPAAAAEVDLLGALAYGELTSFLRLSSEAADGPTLQDVEGLAGLGVEHFEHFRLLRDRLVELGVEPADAMAPFTAALDAFHARTTPSDWYESLVKAFVGDGIATDFYLEISTRVGHTTRDLVQRVLGGTRAGADGEVPGAEVARAEFVVATVGRATAADPQLSSRLALWGRRLVGEALSQAQGVVVQHPALAALLTGTGTAGNGHGADLVEVGAVFTRMTQAHVRRMGQLGLTA